MSRIWMASLTGLRKALLAELLWVVVSLGWSVCWVVVVLGRVLVVLGWVVVVFSWAVVGFRWGGVGFGWGRVGLWVGVVMMCLVETCLMVTGEGVPGEKKQQQQWHQNLFSVMSGH